MTLFQFHFGTIRSVIDSANTNSLSKFQFHFGTIRSQCDRISDSINSSFNSTLVRLEEATPFAKENEYQFQFHFGTIRSKVCL